MPMSARHFRQAPILLTALRGVLGPFVIACAYLRPDPTLLACCVVVAFLSDVFDGIIARRLGVATANLRRLDSIADSVFYLCALWAVWVLHPGIILANAAPLLVLAAVEGARYLLDVWKFGREASYHMWSSKAWGIALCVAFVAAFATEEPGLLPLLAIGIGVIADAEGLLISLTLRSWRHDVPTIFHALRIRAGG
jgi:phosphatidylglycerophosphate synthase